VVITVLKDIVPPFVVKDKTSIRAALDILRCVSDERQTTKTSGGAKYEQVVSLNGDIQRIDVLYCKRRFL